jgi:hypothetical protein
MLDGTLDVLLDSGFNPAIGSTLKFLLFNPGALSGQFASIQNDVFNGGTEEWAELKSNGRAEEQQRAAACARAAGGTCLAPWLTRKGKSCAGITRWVYSVEPLGNQNRNSGSGDEA